MIIKPRTIDNRDETPRTTVPRPKPDGAFDGWGPRLHY